MTQKIRKVGFVLAAGLGLLALGCDPGGVGDPCVPEDEYNRGFSGFSETEVNVESRSFQCETRVCLVNHFRGRVSCPYGQTEADLMLPPDDPRRCRVPGASGANEVDAIDVVVEPQLVERQANNAVYCSCRCDGPDPNARYCECPDGFQCTELVEDLGLGSGQLAGSYCIKDNTAFNPGGSTATCSKDSPNCGNEGNNPPY